MLLDFIDLKNGSGAVYRRLYEALHTAIVNGVIKNGERLPSIREAAEQLSVSRTTVESAYLKLCIEGLAEGLPQRGYFIRTNPPQKPQRTERIEKREMRYDFSGKKIDPAAADTDLWKKTVREVLRDTEELTSYGDPQGEPGLREVLADYSYKARGVITSAENIIVGAGVGPLISILCGLMEKKRSVGIEGGSFDQAARVFENHSIPCTALKSDRNGVILKELEDKDIGTLFLIPSRLAKISITGLSSRRNAVADWVNAENGRLIIEDDYNGELRRSARAVCAFQSKCPEKTVYIVYNQTCGKIEQLALQNYISSGSLERHLRRLRKLNGIKSKCFFDAADKYLPSARITLFEPSLTVLLETDTSKESGELCAAAESRNIKLIPAEKNGAVSLCLSGIPEADIAPALAELRKIFQEDS